MPSYDFSEQEVKALLQALDITTKAHGLASAQACIALATKLSTPMKEEPPKFEED